MAGPTMRAVLFLFAAIATYLAAPAMASKWLPLDPNASEVQEYGKWAVEEHVKQAKDGIKFNKVVSGKEKVGPGGLGLNLDLIIDAWDKDGKDAKYEAELYLSDLMDKRTLLSFKPAN